MGRVTLRVHPLLNEDTEAESPRLVDVPVPLTPGENLDHVVRRLAADDRSLGDALCGDGGQGIRSGIIVVLNDRIINRSEYTTIALQDGDEVSFLPILDGG